MNTLSWLLYLADIADGFSRFGLLFGTFGTVVSLVWYVGCVIHDAYETTPALWLPKSLHLVFPVLLFFGLLVPSGQTVMLIAASEAGEYVALSDRGQEVINSIHEYILKQLEVE